VHDVAEKRGEMESTELLHAWAQHLDSLGVEHSSVIHDPSRSRQHTGPRRPDGILLRIADVPAGGVEHIKMPEGNREPDDPWLNPPPMQHPHGG
jgi:hypothetical protein